MLGVDMLRNAFTAGMEDDACYRLHVPKLSNGEQLCFKNGRDLLQPPLEVVTRDDQRGCDPDHRFVSFF